ncbi:tyrosinase family protein, partial [Streptomyces sp. NPDC058279]|uniref:tyrosinase family protein n=1 Tax=Streptomyces sp. NPDC058279 TaxID=3346418 RepID=UPI0036EF5D07
MSEMTDKRQEYRGHQIELLGRGQGIELLVDAKPIKYGQLSGGKYFLREFAYDWADNLTDLAMRFIDYRDTIDESRVRSRLIARGALRVRKNYRSLTDGERDRFVQALFELKTKGIVDQFARVHASQFNNGIHMTSHFLPWHREFILRFEAELRKVHPDITLPYWDSTVDRSPSDPLWRSTFLGQFDQPWRLNRALGSAALPTQQQVQANQTRGSYDSFWDELEVDIHNPPHRWVGGVMSSAASPGDPAFFLHHCWIDMLWARWQIAHPDVPFVSSSAGFGLNDPMAEWPDRTPAQVLDHHVLGYSYDFEPAPAAPARKADIVWHHDNTGETQIWQMDGDRITRRATVVGENGSPALVGPPFRIMGVGDVTGDGKADIVWHHDNTGETQIWQMDGDRITRRATVVGENGSPALVGPPFRIMGVGDVTGDGKADIVWHHDNTGETQIWRMDGSRITGRATVLAEEPSPALVGPPFRIMGVGDVTGDGKADIVWHHDNTGETQIWQMDGDRITRRATVVGENGSPALVGPPFRIMGVG